MLIAPAGKKQSMDEVGDVVSDGIGKLQDGLGAFVVFAEHVEETAVLQPIHTIAANNNVIDDILLNRIYLFME